MLTDTKIRQTKPGDKPKKLFDGEGLFLIVTKKSKRWYVRYTLKGERIERALGAYPTLTLFDARKKAMDIQVSARNGLDPFTKSAGQSVTFAEAFELLFALDAKRLSEDTMRNRRQRYERYVKRSLGKKLLAEITAEDVRNIVLPLHDSGREASAKRVRIIIGQVYRDGAVRYGLMHDPTQLSQRLPKRKKARHHAHIEDKRLLGRLMGDIERGQHLTAAAIHVALLLQPYVFVRPHQLRFAKVSDFDLDDALWRIQAMGSKTRRIHLVPLSRQCLEILGNRIKEIGHGDVYLFPNPASKTTGVISENALGNHLRKLGYTGDIITPHGFRGTASTLLHEMGYRHEHIEAQLDHLPSDEVSASYNHASYLKQRRQMMQDWADFLDELKNRYGR